jgi:hypothetical protein
MLYIAQSRPSGSYLHRRQKVVYIGERVFLEQPSTVDAISNSTADLWEPECLVEFIFVKPPIINDQSAISLRSNVGKT